MLALGIVCVFEDSQRNILFELQGKQLSKDQIVHSLNKTKPPISNHLTNFAQLISLPSIFVNMRMLCLGIVCVFESEVDGLAYAQAVSCEIFPSEQINSFPHDQFFSSRCTVTLRNKGLETWPMLPRQYQVITGPPKRVTFQSQPSRPAPQIRKNISTSIRIQLAERCTAAHEKVPEVTQHFMENCRPTNTHQL